MKKLILIGLLGSSIFAKAEETMPKDPVVAEIKGNPGKKFKLSDVYRLLIAIMGENAAKLPPEQLQKAISAGKKMLVQQELLSGIASKQGYAENAKYAKEFAESNKRTSVAIFNKVTMDSFSKDELKNKYFPLFLEKARKLMNLNFKLIVVREKKVAEGILRAVKSGTSFESLLVQKSIHTSAKSDFSPGEIKNREDAIARELGPEVTKNLLAMDVGSVSEEVIQTPAGDFAIVKLIARSAAPAIKFEEVEREVREFAARTLIQDKIKQEEKVSKIEYFTLEGKPEAAN